jgi:hypothetical protein
MADRGKMVSVLGKIIVELRSDPAVMAILGVGNERYVVGADAPDDVGGDPGTWKPYVLVRRLGPIRRLPRAPVARGRVSVDTFGKTAQQATELYGAVSDVLSARGPRRSAGGVAIYLSIEEVGGQAVLDPDTDQPVERSIYSYTAPLAQVGS